MHSADILHFVAEHGYVALALILATGLIGVPVPDEVLLTFTGFLTWQGTVRLPGTIIAALVGSCAGITMSYLVGRGVFRPLAHRFFRQATENRKVSFAAEWLERYGGWALFFSYFMPGIRHVAAYAAGIGRMSFGRFARWAYSGAVFWVLTFLELGRLLGPRWHVVGRWLHHTGTWMMVGLLVFVMAGMWWVYRGRSGRNRL
ncbi:MAG: DedA family protein [Alicyclobacillaceae bacterium]|nr:DedA family protein [Alicyclobacillaceae bacterium]